MMTTSTAGQMDRLGMETGKSRGPKADMRPPLTSSTRSNQRFEEETEGP